jgi:hypothetical protein
MSDLVFALVHLGLLLGVLGYAVYSLVRGNPGRFVLILGLLAVYYLLVLHKPVLKEIRRKRELRGGK